MPSLPNPAGLFPAGRHLSRTDRSNAGLPAEDTDEHR